MSAAQRLAHQPPTRRAARDGAKIATISRAEGGRLHARVGWRSRALDSISIEVYESIPALQDAVHLPQHVRSNKAVFGRPYATYI